LVEFKKIIKIDSKKVKVFCNYGKMNNLLRLIFANGFLTYLPNDPSSRRSFLSFLSMSQFLVMRIKMLYLSRSLSHILQKVLHRVWTHILRRFGDDDFLIILRRLNQSEPHNIRALTSLLCRELPPPVRLTLSQEFISFLEDSEFEERWLQVLSGFPKRRGTNPSEKGLVVVAHELRTLYEHNTLFLILVRFPSWLHKRVFYSASSRQTKSFRALMKSFRRMKKALRGELNDLSLNPYKLVTSILHYFFQEVQNMRHSEWDSLYSIFARESLVPQLLQQEVTEEGRIKDYQLLPMKLPFFPHSFKDCKTILMRCKAAFLFPEISDSLVDLSFLIAKEPVCIANYWKSILSQGLCFVLSMTWLHQRMDPLLGYFIRMWLHSHHPNQDPFFQFHLEKLMHSTGIDGSIPDVVKMWNRFFPKFSNPKFFSIYQKKQISDLFSVYYQIINKPNFFDEIHHFISENSSADNQAYRTTCNQMKGTSIEVHFQRLFHSFFLPVGLDPRLN
jgi:hypothetical protein